MSAETALRQEDDLRHPPAEPGGKARDSLFWQVTLPEQRLAVQVYLFLSGSGRAGYHIAVWGEGADAPIAYATGSGSIGGDLDDAEVDGLHLRQGEDLRTASLTVRRAGVELDLRFDALHDAFTFRDNPDGLPVWFAANRMEQTGRVTGELRLSSPDEKSGRRVIPLDTIGHRDHSWGPRDWSAPQHWKWFVAYTPDGRLAVNGWIWIARGTWGFGGYVLRDDELSPVSFIDVSEATFDDDGGQRLLDAVVVDLDGRELHVRLESFGMLELPDARSGTIVLEAAVTATLDGEKASGQYECEWPSDYFDRSFGRDSERPVGAKP